MNGGTAPPESSRFKALFLLLTMKSLRSSSPAVWPRVLLALLVSLSMGFDLMVSHDVVAERGQASGRVEVTESAIHPGAPIHFEASGPETPHHGCLGCLVQLETGVSPVRQIAAFLLLTGATLRPGEEQAASAFAPPSGPARAPPISSPLA